MDRCIDIPSINKSLIEKSLLNQDHTKDKFVKIIKLDVERGSGASDNDGSIMLRIILSLQTDSGQIVNKKIMYKSKRNETSEHDLTEEFNLFETETKVYNIFLKKMDNLLKLNGDNSNDLAPHCYGIGDNIILMEDLRESGFKMIKASQGMDREHIELALTYLANFHALSMKLIQDNEIDTMSLPPWWMHRNAPVINNMFRGGITLADVIQQEWGPDWKDVPARLRKSSENLSYKLMKLSEETKYNNLQVLNHGDCWSNNIMFSYSDNGALSSMRFVDFQACHFNSLAWDLTYLIYNCVFPDRRHDVMSSLVEFYSAALASYCNIYRFKGSIPSRQEIQAEMDKLVYFGFICSINNIPVFIAMDLPDFQFDMDNLASENSTGAHQSRYYKSERVTKLMKKDLIHFISLKVI